MCDRRPDRSASHVHCDECGRDARQLSVALVADAARLVDLGRRQLHTSCIDELRRRGYVVEVAEGVA